MQPSDSLPPSATAPVPLAGGLPRCGRLFCAPWADDTCARNVSCVGDGSPALRETGMCRGEARASQVTGPSSSCVPWSNTPPDTSPSSPTSRRGRCCLRVESSTLGIREDYRFRGRSPTARTFACLRIAGPVSRTGARLATGSGGLTLGRAGTWESHLSPCLLPDGGPGDQRPWRGRGLPPDHEPVRDTTNARKQARYREASDKRSDPRGAGWQS